MTDSTHPVRTAAGDDRPSVVDVVVVGAGISGLAAADALTRTGAVVAVLEARPRTGGRLLSTPLDVGATWFWDEERRVEALTRRFGIATFPQHLAGDTIVEDQGGVQRYAGNLIDVPAHRYAEGGATLTDALASALPTDTVHLDHPVEQVTVTGRDTTGTSTADTQNSGHVMHVTSRGRAWRAHHVVLALPPAVAVDTIRLPEELPLAVTRLAAETPVWMGQTVKVVAAYDDPFWRHNGLAGAAASRLGPLQEIHDMSGPGGRPAALFGFAHPARIGADADREIRDQLGRMFGPRARTPHQLTIHNWSTERWTSPAPGLLDGSVGSPAAGDYGLFGHHFYQRPAVKGRLHWASTETAPTYAGHVEGALEAAERSVAAICADLQRLQAQSPATT